MTDRAPLEVRVHEWLSEIYRPLLSRCEVVSLSLNAGSRISGVTAILRDGTVEELVLRQIINDDWLHREGDLIAREAKALQLATASSVPSPRVIDTDSLGIRTGCPSLLMSRIKGVSWQHDQPLTRNAIASLAGTLRRIHQSSLDGNLLSLPEYEPHHWRSLELTLQPRWVTSAELWRKAVRITRNWEFNIQDRSESRLVHRDYRLENMLWRGDSVVGVLDWITTCRGSGMVDVGHCRWNLARVYGMDAANAFTESYGVDTYNRIWDIYAAIGGVPDTVPQTRGEEVHLDHFLEAATLATDGD